MMKKFSTRANKWFYVFALISHIFNFFAKSQIFFLYHIDDHQKDHLFLIFKSFFKSIFKSFSFFFLFIFIIFLFFFSFNSFSSSFFFFSFRFVFLLFFFQFFSSFSFFFNFRRSRESRLSSFFVICSIFRKSEKILFFLFFLFFFFFFFSSECFASLNQLKTFMTCSRTQTFAIT